MIIVLICYLNSIINTYITCIDSADSPLGISLRSPLLVRSPPTSCSSSREESSWDSFQPLLPEVCLSQIWQETQIAVRYTKLLIAGWRVWLWELVLWLVILFQTSKYLHVRTVWNPTIQPVFLKLTCTSQQVFLYNSFLQGQETFRSDRPKWPDQSKWTTFKASPKYSGQTKLKWQTLYQPKFIEFRVEWKVPKTSNGHHMWLIPYVSQYIFRSFLSWLLLCY